MKKEHIAVVIGFTEFHVENWLRKQAIDSKAKQLHQEDKEIPKSFHDESCRLLLSRYNTVAFCTNKEKALEYIRNSLQYYPQLFDYILIESIDANMDADNHREETWLRLERYDRDNNRLFYKPCSRPEFVRGTCHFA